MEPIEKDITPSDEWLLSLNATCNRLVTQYCNILKSASSIVALNNNTNNTNTNNSSNAIMMTTIDTSSSSVSGAANSNIIPTSSVTSTGTISGPLIVGTTTTTTSSSNTATTTLTTTGSNNNNNNNNNSNRMQHDPRSGGGYMTMNDMVAPPPLAADVAIQTTIQCQLSIENICVATSQILNLIRTLRVSLLLMDDITISAEEYLQIEQTNQYTQDAITAAMELEQQYIELLKKQLD